MGLFSSLMVDFEYKNEKGSLTQLIHEGYSQVNVLTTRKDTERGEHYHKVSTEAFFIVEGSVYVTLKRGDLEEKAIFHEGDFFSIPPYTWHCMSFPENCTMVALYDIPIENCNGTKDIYE